MPLYNREGRRIFYLDEGHGPAVYLVPGTRADHSSYSQQVKQLAGAGYRAIIPDRVGCGQSDPGTTQCSVESEAEDDWALLNHLEIRRAVLLGHSSGGDIIREMYLDSPDRVIGLISVDSPAFGRLTDIIKADMPDDAPIDRGLSPRLDTETAVLYHKHKATLQKIGRLWDYPSDMNVQFLLEAVERWKKRMKAGPKTHPPAQQQNQSPALELSDKWCRVPLLVCTAGRGRIGPDDPEAKALAEKLPSLDASLVVIKNSGHWMHIETADLFNDELITFLNRLRANESSW